MNYEKLDKTNLKCDELFIILKFLFVIKLLHRKRA